MSWLLLLLVGFDTLDGWEITEGARGPGVEKVSEVSIDAGELRLSGDAATTVWRMAGKSVPVRGGDRVFLRVAARCRGIAPEGARFRNANALLIFDRPRTLVRSAVMTGGLERVDLYVHALAPKEATKVTVALFLSMPGAIWFDDPRLSVTPGDQLDAAAFEALRTHLERTYPFFDLAGKPRPDELPSGSGLLAFLAPLRDTHVWIQGGGRRLATFASSRATVSPPPDGTVGYLEIDNFTSGGFEERLDAMKECPTLILDVRRNGGGDERLARRIAARFASRRVAYAKVQVRDPCLPGLHGFCPPAEQVLEPAERHDPRKVVVLQGPGTVSSAEGFVLMMRALENVTTVGQPTRGASGNPQPFEILPGTQVFLPTWRRLLPDGTPIEGRGIPPEIECPDGEAIARAAALLR